MHYSQSELLETFGSVGKGVQVEKSCAIYGGKNIHIGSHVRVDCFSVLSAGNRGIWIGDYVHIAVGCCLFGSGGKIQIEDFAGLSARSLLYTATDDFVYGFMTNPTVPDKYRRVTTGDIILRKHVIVGCGSVIMPCTLGVGASVGALSYVNSDVPDFDVVRGVPAVRVAARGRQILLLEKRLREEEGQA